MYNLCFFTISILCANLSLLVCLHLKLYHLANSNKIWLELCGRIGTQGQGSRSRFVYTNLVCTKQKQTKNYIGTVLWFSITYSTSIKTMQTGLVNKLCYRSYWIIFSKTILWLHFYLMWRWSNYLSNYFFFSNFFPYNWSGVHSVHAWQT